MKKTMLALGAIGLLMATPSCKKGENDPFLSLKSRKGRLTAEWTVSSFVDNSTYSSTYEDDADIPDEQIAHEETDVTTYENGVISSDSRSTDTYDGDGMFNTTSESNQTIASGATVTSTTTTVGDVTVTQESTGTYTSSYDWTITFEKDGTFSMTRTAATTKVYTDDDDAAYTEVNTQISSYTSTITGTWSFISKNKSDEFKNKERIALWYQSTSSTSVNESEYEYTDHDAADFTDWTLNDSKNKSTSTPTYTEKSTSPDEVWELDMLKGKEISAVRTYKSTNTGSYTSEYTSGGTTVSSTSPSNSSSEGTTTMTLTRD